MGHGCCLLHADAASLQASPCIERYFTAMKTQVSKEGKLKVKKRRSSTQFVPASWFIRLSLLGAGWWVSVCWCSIIKILISSHICIYSNCEPSHEHHWRCMSWTMWILMVLHLQAPTVFACLLACLLLHSYTLQSIAASFCGFWTWVLVVSNFNFDDLCETSFALKQPRTAVSWYMTDSLV